MTRPRVRTLDTVPPSPPELDDEGKAIWLSAAGFLVPRKRLTHADLPALQSYVCAVRSVQVLDRALIERGIVIDGEPSPLLGARNAASNLARSWSHSLGLVPDGRKQWKAEDEEEPPRESALAILTQIDARRRRA